LRCTITVLDATPFTPQMLSVAFGRRYPAWHLLWIARVLVDNLFGPR